ncbi:transmembrane protein 272-like [Physella acuta]|uniref:transmembrane protein 272-like n=1 Tax=Physella acuta TaxID=109671 RepID=UPI0027DDB4FB|nr:transmembrane protein 272-like [Physella acuta]
MSATSQQIEMSPGTKQTANPGSEPHQPDVEIQNVTTDPPVYETLCERIICLLEGSIISFISAVCCTVSLGIFMLLPISLLVIAIGVKYMDQCPIEPAIPKYLIAAGSLDSAGVLINLILRLAKVDKMRADKVQKRVNVVGMFSCIAGGVFVYKIYRDVSYDPTHPNKYCNEAVFLFAFWYTVSVYAILGLSLLFGCALCMFACAFSIAQ